MEAYSILVEIELQEFTMFGAWTRESHRMIRTGLNQARNLWSPWSFWIFKELQPVRGIAVYRCHCTVTLSSSLYIAVYFSSRTVYSLDSYLRHSYSSSYSLLTYLLIHCLLSLFISFLMSLQCKSQAATALRCSPNRHVAHKSQSARDRSGGHRKP